MVGRSEIRVPNTIDRLGKKERYKQVVADLRSTFEGSGLVRSFRQITEHDLGLISLAFNTISPLVPESQQVIAEDKAHPHKLNNPSTFDNWEDVGGPQEHMDLVMKGAGALTRLIQSHLKPKAQAVNQWEEESIHKLAQINPYHAAAAGGLHDVGRFITHTFFSNDLIGGSILNKVGIRKDISRVHPDERVMQATPGTMYEAMKNIEPEAVIIRIADEFSKRVAGANRILQFEDFDPVAQEAWGRKYTNRDSTGLASDNWFRRHISRHNSNAPEYFESLNQWCLDMTGKHLWYFASRLSASLSDFVPFLPDEKLWEKTVVISDNLSNGEIYSGKIENENGQIELKATTNIGGPNKRFNEDGFSLRFNGQVLDVTVVDGGTQIAQVESLGSISGGKYIAEKAIQFSRLLSPKTPAARSLEGLNAMIRHDIETNHPDIEFSPESKKIPYGCVAYVKVDMGKGKIEIANAGDVFVIAVDNDGTPSLLSHDDVRPYDQASFQRASEIARDNGVSIREAIEHAMKQDDEKYKPILDQMLENMKASNSGQIGRIMGLDQPMIHSTALSSGQISKLLIGSDGAIPVGFDIHTEEGLRDYIALLSKVGVEGLRAEIEKSSEADPDFELSPRFRDIDDMVLVELTL